LQPDFVAWKGLASGALTRVLAEWQAPPLHVHLVTPPGLRRAPRVTAFIDFLAAQLAKPPPWSGL
jgi:DNA-binding transcriptional LysR family regulator